MKPINDFLSVYVFYDHIFNIIMNELVISMQSIPVEHCTSRSDWKALKCRILDFFVNKFRYSKCIVKKLKKDNYLHIFI